MAAEYLHGIQGKRQELEYTIRNKDNNIFVKVQILNPEDLEQLGLIKYIKRPMEVRTIRRDQYISGGSVVASYSISITRLYSNLEKFLLEYSHQLKGKLANTKIIIGIDSAENLQKYFGIPIFPNGIQKKKDILNRVKETNLESIFENFFRGYNDDEEFAVYSIIDEERRLYMSVILRNGVFNKVIFYYAVRL